MEANRTRTRWTYAEFARLSSERGERNEIICGEAHVTPSPSSAHQRVVTRLSALLHGFVRENALGEVFVGPIDVLLEDGDYLAPDVVFVATERASLVTDRGIEGPPDLVVEVASLSTAERDRGVKLERYRLYGVSEYWVVDPRARIVEAWDLTGGAEEPVVSGDEEVMPWTPRRGSETLEVDVGALFA